MIAMATKALIFMNSLAGHTRSGVRSDWKEQDGPVFLACPDTGFFKNTDTVRKALDLWRCFRIALSRQCVFLYGIRNFLSGDKEE